MGKIETIDAFLQTLNEDEKNFYHQLEKLIIKANHEVVSKIFVSQPYFYLEKYDHINHHKRPSIMMSFFRDHVNIFSAHNNAFKQRLSEYKFTEKHTLQIYFNQELIEDTLVELFRVSLESL